MHFKMLVKDLKKIILIFFWEINLIFIIFKNIPDKKRNQIKKYKENYEMKKKKINYVS